MPSELLVEELLRPVFQEHPELCNMQDLLQVLEELSVESRNAKMRLSCVIKPVFTILKYVRAERESDFALHMACVKDMIPLFFAANHFNYARYGLYYL